MDTITMLDGKRTPRLEYIRNAFEAKPHRPSGFDTATLIAAPLEGKVEREDVEIDTVDAELDERDQATGISPELAAAFGE